MYARCVNGNPTDILPDMRATVLPAGSWLGTLATVSSMWADIPWMWESCGTLAQMLNADHRRIATHVTACHRLGLSLCIPAEKFQILEAERWR